MKTQAELEKERICKEMRNETHRNLYFNGYQEGKEAGIEQENKVSKMRIHNLIKEQINLQNKLEASEKQRFNLIEFIQSKGLEEEFWEKNLKDAPNNKREQAQLTQIIEMKKKILEVLDINEMKFKTKLDEYFDTEIHRQEAGKFIEDFMESIKQQVEKL